MAKKTGLKYTKIGIKKQVHICAEEDKSAGENIHHDCISSDMPLPGLPAALKELGDYMVGLLEAPADWKRYAKCTSVAIGHEEDDRINVVVSLSVTLPKFPSPFNLNTPCLREKLAGKPGGGVFMSAKMYDLVQEVIGEGKKYYEGKRAQGSLLPPPDAETEEETDEADDE